MFNEKKKLVNHNLNKFSKILPKCPTALTYYKINIATSLHIDTKNIDFSRHP